MKWNTKKDLIKQFKDCERKQIEVNDLSVGQYSISKNIRFNNSILRSDLCDYSNSNVIVKRAITVEVIADTNKEVKTNI